MKNRTLAIGAALALTAGLCGGAQAQLIETHTYQGRLNSGGTPAAGVHEVRLRVFDAAAAGTQLAEEIRQKNFVTADDGLFTFDDLNFGDIFGTGADRWIELSVRQGVAGAFTVLGPRTPVTSVPTADVARQIALPYADVANAGLFQAAFQIENTDPAGWALFARSGPSSGFAWNTATAVFDVAETGPLFGLITTGAVSGIAAVGVHPGTNGLQAERHSTNPTGSALFVFDVADGNDARFGTSDYSGDFSGPVRFQNVVDISGEEIDSTEISDEPGIANVISGATSGFALASTPSNIATRSITVPGPGYVIAMANADMQLDHTAGTILDVVFGCSDTSASLDFFGAQDFQTRLPGGAGSGFYDIPATAHAVFSVPSAGIHTYYFVGFESVGNGAVVWDVNFTLIYIPTAYGAVSSTLPPPAGVQTPPQLSQPVRGGMTFAEEQAEYHAELARHLAVLDSKQREIETLMIEMEALRERVQPSILDLPAAKRED